MNDMHAHLGRRETFSLPFTREEIERSLLDRFARVADAWPSAVAVSSPGGHLSYRELACRSDALAAAIGRQAGARQAPLAVLLSDPASMITGILAAWKAGRLCVPLDHSLPPARLDVILRAAEPGLIVTDKRGEATLPPSASLPARRLLLDDVNLLETVQAPRVAVTADTLACLLYTSGSTGEPKGVLRTHRNMLHRARCAITSLALRPEDRVSALHSPAFGAGLRDVMTALLGGAALVPFDLRREGFGALAKWIGQERISVLCAVVSTIRKALATLGPQARFPAVRIVRLGGEALYRQDVERLRQFVSPECVFIAGYGASEASGIVEYRIERNTPLPSGRVPAGYALDGVEISIAGSEGHAPDPGQAGEVVVRSRYLSTGYWRQPDLTRATFLPDPVDAQMRLYRTGDIGRLRADGCLEILGRRDHQAKVRGYLVHPGEVEAALVEHPGIGEAVVAAHSDATGDTRLAAYVVSQNAPAPNAGELRNHLLARLPAYMVPSAFVALGALPLNAHGKVDRDALPPPPRSFAARPAEFVAPRNPMERQIAAIWERLFAVYPIGAHDDFFDLGGDSLIAAAFVAEIEEACGRLLSPSLLMETSTVGELASAMARIEKGFNERGTPLRASGESALGNNLPPLVRAPREPPPPLSYEQERIWKFSRTQAQSASYVMGRAYDIAGTLDVALLRECMTYLQRRHEMLRTTFPVVNQTPVQWVHPPGPADLEFVDLAHAADPAEQIPALMRRAIERTFDLDRLPLYRFLLIRTGAQEHVLYRTSHHIIEDGRSWNVYFRELGQLYEAMLRGEAAPLPAQEPLQYADYAAWQRDVLRPDRAAYRDAVAWWMALLVGRPQPLKLPFMREKPVQGVDPAEGTLAWGTPPRTWARLDELGRAEGATLFVVRLAVLGARLATSTGERDMIIGSYVSNRNRVALQSMFGFFANLVTLRLRFDPDRTFREWLSDVRRTVSDAAAHGDVPYEELFAALTARGFEPPPIRAIINRSTEHPALQFAGLKMTTRTHAGHHMPWGFSISIENRNHDRDSSVHFDAGIYDPAGVREFVARYENLLDAVSQQPDTPLRELI